MQGTPNGFWEPFLMCRMQVRSLDPEGFEYPTGLGLYAAVKPESLQGFVANFF